MTSATLKLPGRLLGDWLREICLERRTGQLHIASEPGATSLFFIGGDLYLPPEHPLFEAARTWRNDSAGGEAKAEGEPESERHSAPTDALAFRALADKILDLAGGPSARDCSFAPGAGQIRIDLVGPLPTSQLLMESAVRGCDDRQLLRRLGGEKVQLRATALGGHLPAGVELDPEEAFLLSRLEHPVAVAELLHQVELGRQEVLERLCRMLAVDLIAAVDAESSEVEAHGPKELLVQRFSQRIAESLKSEPLAVEADQHRELLRNLFARMGDMTHFELLAVTTQSTDSEIHRAFFELGRLVHPVHAEHLGLAGREGALGVLFERATEAYLTLSDPDRKIRYCEELGPGLKEVTPTLSEEERLEEKRRVARQHYELASGLAGRQEFHSAIQLLEQAVKADPQVEYLTLLANCQAENPQWLDRAVANFEHAIRLRPQDPSLRARLGQVLEQRGEATRAKQVYQGALELAPQQLEARAGLQRVGASSLPGSKDNLLDRLRTWIRRVSQ